MHSRHCRLPHCHPTHHQQHRNIISIMLTRVSILVEGLDLLIRVSQTFGRGHKERSPSTEHVTRRPNPCCDPSSRTHVEIFISVTRTDLNRCGWMRLQAGVAAIKRAIRFHSLVWLRIEQGFGWANSCCLLELSPDTANGRSGLWIWVRTRKVRPSWCGLRTARTLQTSSRLLSRRVSV